MFIQTNTHTDKTERKRETVNERQRERETKGGRERERGNAISYFLGNLRQ